jgi:glycosyltransferase involved in cell wall biosynthesis
MRVLHVYAGPFPSPQGTQVYLRGLMDGQVRLGFDVHLRCWGGAGSGTSPEGVRVRRIARGRSLRSGPSWERVPAAWELRRALSDDLQEPWDAVHLHHTEATLFLPREFRGLSVYHLHTSLHEELPSYGGVFRAFGALVGGALDRRLARSADGIIALSPRGAEIAARAGARRVAVVTPGVETFRSTSSMALERRRDPWLVYAGNLDAYQEMDRLLSLVRRANANLLIVTDAGAPGLWARVDRERLPRAAVRVVRATDPRDVMRHVARADVGVLARRRCAGFPMKVLNYLASGLPVVAFEEAVPAVPGVVRVGSDEAFVGAVHRLTKDHEFRIMLGEHALSHAGASLTWTRHAASVRDFVLSWGQEREREGCG